MSRQALPSPQPNKQSPFHQPAKAKRGLKATKTLNTKTTRKDSKTTNRARSQIKLTDKQNHQNNWSKQTSPPTTRKSHQYRTKHRQSSQRPQPTSFQQSKTNLQPKQP